MNQNTTVFASYGGAHANPHLTMAIRSVSRLNGLDELLELYDQLIAALKDRRENFIASDLLELGLCLS